MTIVQTDFANYRQLVAIRYLNASDELWKGLKAQQGKNDFHFLVTLRSFIEYTRRGIWFLAWANENRLERAEHLTFKDAGSPSLQKMDELLNEALGLGRICPLMNIVPNVNEPYMNCLHALTHGNPISVRMVGMGLENVFDTASLLVKTEVDLNIFRILLYRRLAGEELQSIWKMLSTIHNRPEDLRANAKIAAYQLKKKGGPKIPVTTA
ncbi:MAG: hypothetical protein ABSC62_05670 [Terracidiphilus sp.]|jgi:hypothetical protein